MRSKPSQQQGLKQAYLASIDHPRRLLEKSAKLLELKGEPVVIVFLTNDDDGATIFVLGKAEPQIKKESDIPHLS